VLKAHVDAIAADAPSAIAGGWIANVAQSKRHPSNRFRMDARSPSPTTAASR
jgi:hypothetical protein